MDEADRVNPHLCTTRDGGPVFCYCIRAEDHDEEPFDLWVDERRTDNG